MRAALEGLAVAEIIASAEREKAVATLRKGLSRLSDSDGDFATKLEADLGFHLLLCQLSGNAMLVEAWRYLEGRIRVTIMNCESADAPSMMARDPARPDRRRDRARRRGSREVGRRPAHGGRRGAVRPDDALVDCRSVAAPRRPAHGPTARASTAPPFG